MFISSYWQMMGVSKAYFLPEVWELLALKRERLVIHHMPMKHVELIHGHGVLD